MEDKKELKNLKIPEGTHKKLKIYVATSGYSIIDFATLAIEKAIKEKVVIKQS